MSISALSAQNHTYILQDNGGRYEFEVETTPSYCEKEGTLSVRLVRALAATSPQINQIKEVKYNVRDKEGHSYTKVDNNNYYYLPASTPDAVLLVSSLPGREDYEINVKITMWDNLNKAPIETQLVGKIVVENKYVPLVLMKEEFDPYRLSCRPYGGFDIAVRGSEDNPPHLTFEVAPATFTGAKTMQPTRKEIKDGDLLYHYEYKGVLPQGTYKYRFTNDCMSTEAKTFTVYGPKPDLPTTVPQDLTMRFGIDAMSAEGCGEDILQLGSRSSDKLVLRTFFEAINKGYQGDSNKPYPEYLDSFPSTFKKNYEVAVITQREYEELKKGALNVDNLLWSDQTGSPSSVTAAVGGAEPGFSSRLPQAMSLQELEAKKAFPGALLIRIKRPNTGCNDYITIPITVNLNYVGGGESGGGRFQILETESTLDCSIGQIVWFEGWNFCSLYIKYYELPAGVNEPAPGAKPVHTSENFGPAVSTAIDKRYTFDKFDAKKRYYVELDVIDLYGRPVTPKPHLIIEPTNKEPIPNRLYDFYPMYVKVPQPLSEKGLLGRWYPVLTGPASYIYIEPQKQSWTKSLNALAGMEVTLVKAPEGYERFQSVAEHCYYRKPDPSNQSNPYGGGMIKLGETVEVSTDFTRKYGSTDKFYPFKFLYKPGDNGKRIVYPYKSWNNPIPGDDRFEPSSITVDDELREAEKYLKEHPMPRGVYCFRFEHPCQPGDFFYIDIDVSEPTYFKPTLTKPLEPVVDYSSCDEVRIYPFADKRLDYGVDKKGRPRNMVFRVNYRRAMVRYNFGVAKGTGYDSDRHIYTTEEVNTDDKMYGRDELNLLAAPLYDIYAGDYSFSASPYTYQLGFKAERAGKSMGATFDPTAFNDPSPLQSISMAGNNNCIALVVVKDAQGFNRKGSTVPVITQRRGILELPYFDRPDIANSFYYQTYDASTGQTRFQYFDDKAQRFRGYYSYAQRSKMAYRFIFEDPATQRISKLAGDTEGYTMDVNATAAGQEVMVGNPFMTPLQVVPFLDANKAVIEPYVRLLYPVDVKGYDPKLTLDGRVVTYNRAAAEGVKIDQLGAFVVKLKSGVGPKVQLVFPTTALDSYAKLHPQNTSSLRSTSGDATAETARYLSLTLQSRLGKDRALVAYGYESGSIDKMLLSTESRYPSIAIVDPADGLYKDLYADDAATGHYELATQASEPIDVTLSLAGSVMGHVKVARLIDHRSGLEHDLTGGKSCQIKLFPDDREGHLELRVNGDFTSVAPMVEPTAELEAQYSEGMLTVRTTQDMSSLRLVQGDGITVYTQSLPGLTEYSERILLSSGSYVVEAVGTDGVARRAMLVVR